MHPPGSVSRRDRIGWRLDPVVATLSRWADESPEAMRRLLRDAELRAQLERAIADVLGEGGEGPAAALA